MLQSNREFPLDRRSRKTVEISAVFREEEFEKSNFLWNQRLFSHLLFQCQGVESWFLLQPQLLIWQVKEHRVYESEYRLNLALQSTTEDTYKVCCSVQDSLRDHDASKNNNLLTSKHVGYHETSPCVQAHLERKGK